MADMLNCNQAGNQASIRRGLSGAGCSCPRLGDMSEIPADLARLRASIDNLDNALVCLLAERFKVTKQVGVLKATKGLPPADPKREEEQIARLRRLADEAGLDPEFAQKFLTFIVSEVVRHHEAIAIGTTAGG